MNKVATKDSTFVLFTQISRSSIKRSMNIPISMQFKQLNWNSSKFDSDYESKPPPPLPDIDRLGKSRQKRAKVVIESTMENQICALFAILSSRCKSWSISVVSNILCALYTDNSIHILIDNPFEQN